MSRTILWVDDLRPAEALPAEVLKALQATVVTVKSTRQALVQLQARRFDAIVSDMARWEGPREGVVLLDAVRRLGLATPFFVFAAGASAGPEVAMALAHGADGSTSHAPELLELLHRALYRRAA